ncbi:MAG: hypothetical protein P4M01_07355 [Acidobacteriota bacterium]|nr:hypothetical protein [Acidobacteriota bacterium]
MSVKKQSESAITLVCCKCGEEFVKASVTASYLGAEFPIELWKCHGCGVVYIPEELAVGKMLKVEQALEDK